MADYMLMMHKLTEGQMTSQAEWSVYLERLGQLGCLRGGSRIGDGACFGKSGSPPATTLHLDGYIRIETDDFASAQELLTGNPTYEAGGIVEIRELPRDD